MPPVQQPAPYQYEPMDLSNVEREVNAIDANTKCHRCGGMGHIARQGATPDSTIYTTRPAQFQARQQGYQGQTARENNRKEEWDGRGCPGASYGCAAGKERGGFMAPKYPPEIRETTEKEDAVSTPLMTPRRGLGPTMVVDGQRTEGDDRMENSDDEASSDFEDKGDGVEQKGGGMAGKARH